MKIITVGSLKEKYLKDAVAEYSKRMSRFCRLDIIELREKLLRDSPSEKEIETALAVEGEAIIALVPQQAVLVALCIEGEQLSSNEFAEKISKFSQISSDLVFVIGSSHGLSTKVKTRANFCLSISKLTFPHQLMRVILLESIYRAYNIQNGTKYHK